MSTLPFSISPDAFTWIVEKLHWAEKVPKYAALAPALRVENGVSSVFGVCYSTQN
jgi:hypothetical protein